MHSFKSDIFIFEKYAKRLNRSSSVHNDPLLITKEGEGGWVGVGGSVVSNKFLLGVACMKFETEPPLSRKIDRHQRIFCIGCRKQLS